MNVAVQHDAEQGIKYPASNRKKCNNYLPQLCVYAADDGAQITLDLI